MKRLSIYFIYSISVVSLVVAFDVYFQRKWNLEFYRKDFFTKADLLNGEAYVARLIDQTQGAPELEKYLQARVQSGRIGYWLIVGDQHILAGSLPSEIAPRDLTKSFLLDAKAGEVLKDPTRQNYYAVDGLEHDRQLIVGLIYNEDEFLRIEEAAASSYVWRYLVGIATIIIATFVFFIRDILRSIRQFQSRLKGQRRGLVFSREAEILSRGLHAIKTADLDLKSERDLLNLQIRQSLLSELKLKRPAPYEFPAILVRTDINGFSTIYNRFPVHPFTETINAFFTEATEIINRHGGLVHEFIGDEIIYYFKYEETNRADRFVQAVAAIRDVGIIAERISAMTEKERGYPFTIKSALAEGNLHFSRLVDGFSISGPPFVESVRILSAISEKNENSLVFDVRHLSPVCRIAQFRDYATVQLKGLSGDRTLCIVDRYQELVPLCQWTDTMDLLRFFRSDRDLNQILLWLSQTWKSAPEPVLLQTLALLREIPIARYHLHHRSLLLNWLLQIYSHEADDDTRPNLLLASLVSLLPVFVKPNPSDFEIVALLENALEFSDLRVIANAVEAIAHMQGEDFASRKELLHHVDNRVAANMLVHAGKNDLKPKTISRLKKMLESRNPSQIASAVWAIAEIAIYLREQDTVFYETQVDFLKLVDRIPELAEDGDGLVQRQAAKALVRLGLSEEIRATG